MELTKEMEQALADAWSEDHEKGVQFYLAADGIKEAYKRLARYALKTTDGRYLVLMFDDLDLFVANSAIDQGEFPPFVTNLGEDKEWKRYLVTPIKDDDE